MDSLSASAASGLRARMESLELLANNLANAGTAGYKSDRESYNLYLAPEAEANDAPTVLPVIERQWTDLSPGAVHPTGNPLDVAIEGQGFFAVNGPRGTLYTRNGSFRVAAGGYLATAEGYAVRGAGGTPIQVNPEHAVEILPDGTVRQDGASAGRLELADFSNPSVLVKQGGTYFRAAAPPRPAASAAVGQGKLEGSNVGGPESAVRLIGVMRQFEMLQKAIALGAEMNRRAVEDVARVGA